MQQYELHGTEASTPRPLVRDCCLGGQILGAGGISLDTDQSICSRDRAKQSKRHVLILLLLLLSFNVDSQETNLALREEIDSYQGIHIVSLPDENAVILLSVSQTVSPPPPPSLSLILFMIASLIV